MNSQQPHSASSSSEPLVPAGRLPPWQVGELPAPPRPGWRLWIGLVGPGVVLAGTSIGTGEWLFGPAVSAQYGATLLWLASISIILQVFCNLMMMRYTLYCGEPIMVGGLRTWPGPRGWITFYVLMDLVGLWPYNAANAAVPLAAAILGHLPGDANILLFGQTIDEKFFVRLLGILIFTLALVPLIFGGTVYRMLEKVMSFKLILILGYLTFVAVFLVSSNVAWDVFTGFFRFGAYPERAQTVIVDPHFNYTFTDGADHLLIKGTREHGGTFVAEYWVNGVKQPGPDKLTKKELQQRDAAVERALALMRADSFFLETQPEDGVVLEASGKVDRSRWLPEEFTVHNAAGEQHYDTLAAVPPEYRSRLAELIEHRGLEQRSMVSYVAKNGRLPDLDWITLAAFAAIAGAGGLSNCMFSNYTREKGWGMGAHVGAIPSAIGGRTIALSHVGRVFLVNDQSLLRWRGWLRHIFRDQVAIWMVASFLGMALPCMVSLEYIRNATVEGNRVAAMTAEGISSRFPDYARFLWPMTLLVGFLVLAPGQISVGDQVARRWTDMLWTSSARMRKMGDHTVKYVYYSILAMYAVWGFTALCFTSSPLLMAKIGAVLSNVALGVSALQAWNANRTLLPRELQPHRLLQVGTFCCGLFFLGISGVVLYSLLR